MSINLQTGTNRIHKHTHKINTVRTKNKRKQIDGFELLPIGKNNILFYFCFVFFSI
jgi:hypothetical protein